MSKKNRQKNLWSMKYKLYWKSKILLPAIPIQENSLIAVSVRMLIEGINRETIQEILGVSSSFISKWKINYALHGIEGLSLNHHGSRGQLKPQERAEVIQWLTNKNQWDLSELSNHIAKRYQIQFQSKASYYQLFKSAGISWKKSQKKNPKRDEELVKKKHQEICEILEEHRSAIESRKLVVYLIDECHLLWGDVCGYLWGRRNERIEIPLLNEREKQTYYGAVNYLTKQFVRREYATANSENTVAFLKDLQYLNPEARHLIIWDGASYHKYKEMKAYLEEINQGKERDEWPLTCVLESSQCSRTESSRRYLASCQDLGEKIWESAQLFCLG